jgi:AraC-like DNA-binding protein
MFVLSVSENILAFICGLGVLQGLLFAILLYFHPKSDRSVNIFLSLHIFFIATIMTVPFVIRLVGWQNGAFVVQLPLLTGPFLYLYLRSFKERISWRKALPHFLPYLLFSLLSNWNMSIMRPRYPDATLPPGEVLNHPATLFLTYVKPVQQIIYYFLSRSALKSYRQSIRQLFSETSRIDLRWATFLINGYLLLALSFVVVFPFMLRYPEHFIVLLFANMTIVTLYIYMATYKGVMQPTVWQIQHDPDPEKETIEAELQPAIEPESNNSQSKNTKTGLSEEKMDDLMHRITIQMEQEKLYQETELTLRQLAAKLEVPVYQVSQALNDGMKRNFYDLVNGYRVEEAKRLLLDPKNRNYTILSVGFEAGFNSKTTFNTVFKKFTGLTPTHFREVGRPETGVR